MPLWNHLLDGGDRNVSNMKKDHQLRILRRSQGDRPPHGLGELLPPRVGLGGIIQDGRLRKPSLTPFPIV